jgi:3-carboxy-cis,cis-muconate cycloisomerase
MAANLNASGGLPQAERVTGLLAAALGGPRAHDLVAGAAARSVASGIPLRDVILSAPELEESGEKITAAQIEEALDPAGYLGMSDVFITAALRAHNEPASNGTAGNGPSHRDIR